MRRFVTLTRTTVEPIASGSAGPGRYPLIQGLRALAAGAVALDHVAHELAGAMVGAPLLAWLWGAMPWRAGVDIFFAISGFVIVHASEGLFGTASGSVRFLSRRVTRIVPLYWAATTLLLLLLATDRRLLHGSLGSVGYVLRSYLFIPVARPDGLVEPVFGLGWTLDFEMLFYVVFAPCLLLGRSGAVIAVWLVFAGLIGLGRLGLLHGVALQTWADPIVFEFCGGATLALLSRRVHVAPMARGAMFGVAIVWLALAPRELPRLLDWGVPALMMVAAAGLTTPIRGAPRHGVLERLGDASYAMYLVHPFVMRPAGILVRHLADRAPAGLATLAVVLALTQWAALSVHQKVERPALRWLRTRAWAPGLRAGRASVPGRK